MCIININYFSRINDYSLHRPTCLYLAYNLHQRIPTYDPLPGMRGVRSVALGIGSLSNATPVRNFRRSLYL